MNKILLGVEIWRKGDLFISQYLQDRLSRNRTIEMYV